MRVIETKYFNQQLDELEDTYLKVKTDYKEFKTNFNVAFSVNLGGSIYKARSKNSSIPAGKSWWLRFIVKTYNDLAVPMIVYAKSMKQNVTDDEIITALEITLKELKKIGIVE